MEAAAVEYLVYLRQNASQLRKEAEEWGLSEKEINDCITEALESTENPDQFENSPKNVMRKCLHYFRVVVKLAVLTVCIAIAILVGVVLLTTYHTPTEHFMMRTLQPYGYQIFRAVRLATLPIHNIANITKYYDAECLVDNPYYQEEFHIDCNICKGYTKVKVLNASDFTKLKYAVFGNTLKPVLLKGTLKKMASYKDLRRVFQENKQLLSMTTHNMQSSDEKFSDLASLFDEDQEEYINTTQNLHVHWESHTVRTSVVLRTLFPRPHFVPEKSEIGLDKHVLIDGPGMATYQLPHLMNTLNLYTQGTGHRRILLRPKGRCHDECNSLLAFVEPGDALLFHYDLWDPFAATNGEEYSVGYLVGSTIG